MNRSWSMSEQRRVSFAATALFAAVALGLGFNTRVINAPPLYVIHLLLALLFTGVLVAMLARLVAAAPTDSRPRELLAVVFVACLLFRDVGNPRFTDAYGTLLLLLATYYVFRVLYANWEVAPTVFVFALSAGAFIASLRELGIRDFLTRLATITVETRLGLEALGGNNAYALVLSVSCIGLIHLFLTRSSLHYRLIATVGFAYLFLRLVATLSRGGMVGFVLGLVVYLVARSKTPVRAIVRIGVLGGIIAAVGLALAGRLPSIAGRYDLLADPTGAGRLGIWRFLLMELEKTPLALLFGRGAGSIVFTTPWAQIESAHNSYLEAFFTYGLVGLLAVGIVILRVARMAVRLPRSGERSLIWAVTAQLVAGAALDSYHGASQIGWIYAAWFATVLSQQPVTDRSAEPVVFSSAHQQQPLMGFAE